MAAKRGLGKGLDSLIPIEEVNEINKHSGSSEVEDSVNTIKINSIEPNRTQPRKNFNEDSLIELSESIKQHGIIQPLVVQKKEDYYEIIAGERRVKAAQKAGLETIPAIIKDFNDTEMMEIALIENIQREDLNPIEEASAFAAIIDATKMTQEEVAKRFGKSRSYITNLLGLLNLPSKVKNQVQEGKITNVSHAKLEGDNHNWYKKVR